MTAGEILGVVLMTEAVLFAVGVGALIGHVAHRRARDARLRPRVRATRAMVVQALAGDGPVPVLPRLPLDEAVRVLADATGSMDTAARRELAALPACERLVSRGSRWCSARRWSRRLRGVRMLTILGSGQDAVPPLMDDPRSEVRSAAAAWTAHHPTPSGIQGLLRMLDDGALSCRLASRAALVRLGHGVLGPVTAQLTHSQRAALPGILAVAARLGDPSLRGPALVHRAHPDPAVRAAVAGVLTSLGGTESVEALEEFLLEPAPAVRAAAAAGLGALGHWPSAPLLAERLGDPDRDVRRAAGLALSRLGGPGRLYLERARRGHAGSAADMARQVLGGPQATAPERRDG